MSLTRLPSILLLGDSITQFGFQPDGWVSSLANHYIRCYDVINRGLSGFNTRWYKNKISQQIIDENLPLNNVQLITLSLGANDAASNHQHVPLEEYQQNMEAIIEKFKIFKVPIVVITCPPIDEEAWLKTMKMRSNDDTLSKPNRSFDEAHKYAQAALKAAQKTGVFSIDMFSTFSNQPNWKECLNDGLHLSKEGNNLWFETLRELIQKEKLLPKNPKLQFPLWDQVDPENPEQSILKHLQN